MLSVGYSDGFLDLKYGELGLLSLFSKDEAKPQTERGSLAFQFLYVQKCSDIKSNNLSHWNINRIISMTGDCFSKIPLDHCLIFKSHLEMQGLLKIIRS